MRVHRPREGAEGTFDEREATYAGAGDSPDVSCVSLFVQEPVNGRATLGMSPVCKTPAQWGTIFVSDENIVPTTNLSSPTKYRVKALVQPPNTCTSLLIGQYLGTTSTDMWLWGDTVRDNEVEISDLTCVSQAAGGNFSDCSRYAADLTGREGTTCHPPNMSCAPNGDVDCADSNAVFSSYYPGCPAPCPQP